MLRTVTLLFALFSVPAYAEVSVFTQSAQWQQVAPDYSTITFAELPANTWISDQYSALGITFSDGSDLVYNTPNLFVDNYGLNGAFDETTLEFEIEMVAIAVDFPGTLLIRLYLDDTHFYTSPLLGSSGTGFFGGLVSTSPFDRAELYDPFGGLVVDNLYFGPSIPAPGALAMLGLGAMTHNLRRRRT